MKKKLIYILILIIITIGILSPLGLSGTNIANAETTLLGQQVSCGLLSAGGLSGCLAVISSYTYKMSAFVLEGTGYMFDSFLAFSLSNDVLNQDFVNKAWGATRGFANMLFILVLVAISISIILDFGEFNSKKLIRDVIIIALLVNFSLFAAKIVIDTSNIVALSFYDSIGANPKDNPNIKNIKLGEKNISGQVMSLFNPARLIDVDIFKKWSEENTKQNKTSEDSNIMIAVIYLFGTAVSIYMAYLFFMASWIFLVRIAYLWIIMALAPLAFISYVIPTFKSQWTKWWKELFDKSFCIVAFMFMLWLTLLIMGDNFFKGAFDSKNAESVVKMITIIVLQFVMVAVLFGKTLKITRSMCDDGGVGEKVLGWAKSGAGLVAGTVTGGVSFAAGTAARRFVGGAASASVEQLEKEGAGTTRLGRLRLQGHRALEKYSFGTGEGYKQRAERTAKEQETYMKTLPKKIERGKFAGKNAQEMYKEKMSENSIVSWALDKRAGEVKFVKTQEEKEKNQKDLNIKLVQLTKTNQKIKELQQENVSGEQIKEDVEKKDKLEEEIKSLREKRE